MANDNENNSKRLNRRSFMARVAGGAAAAGALATVVGASNARAQNYTGQSDRDPTDPGGYGRTGVTDSDRGQGADRVGYGRGDRSGCSDTDPTDPAGNGRNCSRADQSGLTDTDPTDPAGNGRGGSRGAQSGITDTDPTDPAGNGRGAKRRK
ncbi:MAG: hypothetical protein AB7J28_07545 [Hyphomonadaceae bacterium]